MPPAHAAGAAGLVRLRLALQAPLQDDQACLPSDFAFVAKARGAGGGRFCLVKGERGRYCLKQREGKPPPAYPHAGPATALAGLFRWSGASVLRSAELLNPLGMPT